MKADYIWMNGEMVPFNEANIHVLSHVVHYGSGVFEGMRAYTVKGKAAIFRLDDHIKRLYEGIKVYRMEAPYTQEEYRKAVLDTLRANKLKSAYIRPLYYRGMSSLGVNPKPCPVDALVAAWEWGAYLGDEAIEKGIKAKVSSWTRSAPNTFPTMVKACGNYLSGQLIKMEALELGFDEGIALDVNGNLAEGSGENLFIVKDGVIYTTPISSSILCGITRDTVMKICNKFGYKVVEQTLPREFLYMADEVFFTGTAAELTGVTQVDHQVIGSGYVGEVTKRIQKEYFDIVNGRVTYDESWLTFVEDEGEECSEDRMSDAG